VDRHAGENFFKKKKFLEGTFCIVVIWPLDAFLRHLEFGAFRGR
jgi:hypothetical protein